MSAQVSIHLESSSQPILRGLWLEPSVEPNNNTTQEGSCCSWSSIANCWASWVHSQTAELLSDYPRPGTSHDNRTRALARFVITALATIVAIIVIAFIYISSSPSRTVRHWGSTYLITLPTAEQNYPNLFCPCNKSAIPWPYYVKFYWIDQTFNRYPIINETQLCDRLLVVVNGSVSGYWLQGCYAMVKSVIRYTNVTQKTTLSTNTVTAPSVLAHMITVQMQDSFADAFGDYSYLMLKSLPDWEQLLAVKDFLEKAAFRFVMSIKTNGNQTAVNESFWRYFEGLDVDVWPLADGKLKAFSLTGNVALVMDMVWSIYIQDQCRPLYCDQVVRNSLLRRLLTAAYQVGGFAAIMLVLLRGAVWPTIRYLKGWS